MILDSSISEENSGVSIAYAAFVGANKFAPTLRSTEDFRLIHLLSVPRNCVIPLASRCSLWLELRFLAIGKVY